MMKKSTLIVLSIVGISVAGTLYAANTATGSTNTQHPQNTTVAKEQTATFDIENMTCNMCPITVRRAMKKVDGVVSASADFDNKTATVTFDPSKTNLEEIANASTNAGYPATAQN